jgi:hypothetical protein
MKQQHLLYMAMAILVLYSLIFLQENKYQNLSLNDCIKVAKEKSKQKQIESGLWTSLELTSKAFIQEEDQNFIFPASTFAIPPIDFGMGPLQFPPVKVPAQDVKIMDNKSIGMCLTTLILKLFADVSTNDVAMYVAIGAGITTIIYNIYRVKLTDIKDFDFDRIHTHYSDFDYEKSEYVDTAEVKLYANEYRDSSIPTTPLPGSSMKCRSRR